jgi:hypothetical protein
LYPFAFLLLFLPVTPHTLYSKDMGARGNSLETSCNLHICLQMIKEVTIICITEAKATVRPLSLLVLLRLNGTSKTIEPCVCPAIYFTQETIPAHVPPQSFKKHQADDTYCFFSQTSQATCKMEEWVSSSFDEQSSLSRLVAALTTSFSSDAIPPAFLVVETDEEWAPLR